MQKKFRRGGVRKIPRSKEKKESYLDYIQDLEMRRSHTTGFPTDEGNDPRID